MKKKGKYRVFSLGVPFGSGYPLYLFCLYRTKKDAAAIPYATSKETFSESNKVVHLIRQNEKILSENYPHRKSDQGKDNILTKENIQITNDSCKFNYLVVFGSVKDDG